MRLNGPLIIVLLFWLVGCASTAEQQRLQESAEVNADLGLRYMQQKNYVLARDKLLRAHGQNPDSVKVNHYLGELYRRLDDRTKAAEYFRNAIALSPFKREESLLNNFGVFLCGENQYDEAVELFNEIMDDPVSRQKPMLYENLGLCLIRKPDLKSAEAQFRTALKLNPRMPKSLLKMAELSFDRGKYLSARGYLQRLQELLKFESRTLLLAIQVERHLGDAESAQQYEQQLKRDYPQSKEAKMLMEVGRSEDGR